MHSCALIGHVKCSVETVLVSGALCRLIRVQQNVGWATWNIGSRCKN